MSGILARYVMRRYVATLFGVLGSGASLYLVIEFFDRIGRVLSYDPPTHAVVAYFLFKVPHIVAQVYPAASLLAVLISFAALARDREILALKACGVSTWQLGAPLLVVATLGSAVLLAWNETVVPVTTSQGRYYYDIVIKKRPHLGATSQSSVWFQGRAGFLNIDYFDGAEQTIHGLTVFDADPQFRLRRMIEVEKLEWTGESWDVSNAVEKTLQADGMTSVRKLEPGRFTLAETPEELSAWRRKPKEFSFLDLKRQIEILRAKGLTSDEFSVDLHRKLAWPVSGLVTVLIGFPLAVRGRRRPSVGYNIGLGLTVGFTYWFVNALAISAGRSGSIPPPLAAWTANLIFTTAAAALFLSADEGGG